MSKTASIFSVTTNNGVVENVSKSVIYQPKTNFGGGEVKWFDDNKLLKNPEGGSCHEKN